MYIVWQCVCLGEKNAYMYVCMCVYIYVYIYIYLTQDTPQLQILIIEGLLAFNITTIEKPRSQQEIRRLPEKLINEFIAFPWTVRTLFKACCELGQCIKSLVLGESVRRRSRRANLRTNLGRHFLRVGLARFCFFCFGLSLAWHSEIRLWHLNFETLIS